ncbi:MAG TPA: transcription termination factor NusA, partial [Patescibacteria group bacterium]|nr:transcription termination factor NusA [Patescibacteria group bacterium]
MNQPTIISSIDEICKNKNLSREQVLGAIEQALAAAYRKDFGNKQQNIIVNFDLETGNIEVYEEKEVVEDLPEEQDEDDKVKRYINKNEIELSEAKKLDNDWVNTRKNAKKPKVGDKLRKAREIPSNFGRIAAQTAKQVIIQRLRESERETLYNKYKEKQGEILNGIVQRKDNKNIYIDLSDTTAIMPYREQVQNEKYWIDQKLKVYLKEVKKTTKGPNIIVSRRNPNILKDLIKTEIPEVANGKVEINAIAREPGSRAKIAVSTKEESIDPIGAIIGQKGIRIQTIINEIGGEKIDVIEYSEKPKDFLKNALAPANIVELELKKEKKAIAKVKKDQISLAIGKAG